MMSILPQYVHITLYEMYEAIICFLEKYTMHVQSKDIQLLIIEMKKSYGIQEIRIQEIYLLWLKMFKEQLVESEILKKADDELSSEIIYVDTYDIYMSVIKFLRAYNMIKKSEDIILLASSLGQFHIAQWVYEEWENALKSVLIQSKKTKNSKMHDIK